MFEAEDQLLVVLVLMLLIGVAVIGGAVWLGVHLSRRK